MDPQETIVLRTKRERGSHLATNYGPVGLQITTHASSERHQWTWWTPPWWCLDWILWFWNLWWLDQYFIDYPEGFQNIWEFIVQRGGVGGHRGGHNPPRCALVGCAPLGAPPRCFSGPLGVFWSIKIPQKVLLCSYSVWYWFPTM